MAPAAPEPANTIGRPVDGSLLSIMRFAESMAKTLQDFYDSLDSSNVEEFEAMGQDISRMRSEVARLHADDLAANMLPAIAEMLEGMRDAMSRSADTILQHAEAAINADASDAENYTADVNTHMVHIIEACSFQDLTGQRIDRISDLVGDLSLRLERFANAIGAENGDRDPVTVLSPREKRRANLLLHGPQNGPMTSRQDEIDRLFDED